MYTITKKPKTPNIVWDVENKKVLCRFEKGVIKTEDTELAEKLKALGHTVSGTKSKSASTSKE